MWSFFNDVRDFYRRVNIIVRSRWNYWGSSGEPDDEVNLPKEDEVISAVAERHFALVYPDPAITSSPDDSSVLWINYTSILNTVISFFSNLLRVSSLPLFVYFIYTLIFSRLDLLVIDYGYSVGTMGMYLYDVIWTGTATIAAFTSSLILRELDKVVTMYQCLGIARDTLKDRQIYHQEKCLLALEQINNKAGAEFGKYRVRINARVAEINTLEDMCADIERIPYLDIKSKKGDLAKYRASIRKLSREVASLRKDLDLMKKKVAMARAEVHKSLAMSRLIKVVDTLQSIENGDEARQIEDLKENSKNHLALIEDGVSDLHEDFLIETGTVENNKDPGSLPK